MPDARYVIARAPCLKSGHCPQMPLPDLSDVALPMPAPRFLLPVPTLLYATVYWNLGNICSNSASATTQEAPQDLKKTAYM